MEPSLQLLEKCGIKYSKKARLDIAFSSNMNIAIVFLPATDIGLYVSHGRVDMGITGQDNILESKAEVKELVELGFGKCRLCVQVDVSSTVTDPRDLAGKRIVTSFTGLTTRYFETLNPDVMTDISFVSGSVEIACQLELADAVVDLVESGDTMRAAGLKEIAEILPSQAVLISNPNSKRLKEIELIKRRVQGVVDAAKFVMVEYNVIRSKLSLVLQITPGKNSPTLAPLENDEWLSVKALIYRSETNTILDQLQEIGAEAILIYDVQNCRV
ncbi:uncharacterized protein LOC134193793 isoform X2 [Corticium candelabrum]|nr:uncharacterized protein LOC134193793 isoform X2 [Corticium candelabrum]